MKRVKSKMESIACTHKTMYAEIVKRYAGSNERLFPKVKRGGRSAIHFADAYNNNINWRERRVLHC